MQVVDRKVLNLEPSFEHEQKFGDVGLQSLNQVGISEGKFHNSAADTSATKLRPF
jgi:hypothetical protein